MDNEKTISKAIVFIENNLYEPIAACDVASAAAYSYYHFHRYFQAVIGETIGSYIRSRRLTQAAWNLVHTEKKILDIGGSLYFESAESFTRAFKRRYSMTPTEYRKNGVDVLIANRQSAQKDDRTIIKYANLSPEIVIIPPTYVMGIRFKTSVAENGSVNMWEQFNQQIAALKDPRLSNYRRYGIFEASKTCSSNTFNADSEAPAFIGIEASAEYPVPSGMQWKEICGGKYAIFIHTGPVDTLLQTYHYIWGVWFPKSGFELANRDGFECYTERFVGPEEEGSQIDIYFPIR